MTTKSKTKTILFLRRPTFWPVQIKTIYTIHYIYDKFKIYLFIVAIFLKLVKKLKDSISIGTKLAILTININNNTFSNEPKHSTNIIWKILT